MPKIVIFGSGMGGFEPEITFQFNHEGSVRLAKLAREAGIRRLVRAVTKMERR